MPRLAGLGTASMKITTDNQALGWIMPEGVVMPDEPKIYGRRERVLRTLGMAVLIFLVVSGLDSTAKDLAFVVPEGATGAARVHWSWWHIFAITLADWLSIVPLFLTIAWLVRTSPLEKGRIRRSLLRHGLAIVLISAPQQVVSQVFFAIVNTLVTSWPETRDIFMQMPIKSLLAQVFWFPVFYVQMAAVIYAWQYRQKERAKERRALKLERQLAQAQLQMLRMQLNPHFLFNTLNAVTTLMHRDVNAAEEMLLALTDFLRTTLEERGTIEVALEKEMALAERYLEIERIRFAGRLALDLNVDPQAMGVLVPSFLLQPIVENAVRHGLAPRASGGRIGIHAHLIGDHLQIVVEDDGLGDDSPTKGSGQGLGLSNIRERLFQRYGDQASMEARTLEGGGFRVMLKIPKDAEPMMELETSGAPA